MCEMKLSIANGGRPIVPDRLVISRVLTTSISKSITRWGLPCVSRYGLRALTMKSEWMLWFESPREDIRRNCKYNDLKTNGRVRNNSVGEFNTTRPVV